MSDAIDNMVQELKDRQDIYDCMVRYCRGIDRFDKELVRSAYHSDGMDDHGEYVGPVDGFIEYYFAYHTKYQRRTMHAIHNHTCEIDGNTAHCETYYTFSTINTFKPTHTRATGRYIDRLEKRDGVWRIAVRVCVIHGIGNEADPDGELGDMEFMPSTRDTNDPSYMRPLMIDPARVNNRIFT